MQLKQGSDYIYNGRILNASEMEVYRNTYDELTEYYSAHEALIKRKTAYKTESDPLYMEWQFDQTTESEQAWRDKVEEIKLRYPLVVA
jgi:hypothetical protein